MKKKSDKFDSKRNNKVPIFKADLEYDLPVSDFIIYCYLTFEHSVFLGFIFSSFITSKTILNEIKTS
ncbi:hypothetical protein OAX10_01290 [Flavobacteriales bacterium]|nr:hypothetical protein [Flavobacteriales bacterium]